jgi:hypothetical protein
MSTQLVAPKHSKAFSIRDGWRPTISGTLPLPRRFGVDCALGNGAGYVNPRWPADVLVHSFLSVFLLNLGAEFCGCAEYRATPLSFARAPSFDSQILRFRSSYPSLHLRFSAII